jgi:hypothetical protein
MASQLSVVVHYKICGIFTETMFYFGEPGIDFNCALTLMDRIVV